MNDPKSDEEKRWMRKCGDDDTEDEVANKIV